VRVERRGQFVTADVGASITRASLQNGVFEVDVVLTNNGGQAWLNPVSLAVVGISSSTNDVVVINADNGGPGTSPAEAAVFGYAAQVGADEQLSPGETSAPRTLRFADPSNQLFTFQVQVTAYRNPE